MSADDIYHEWRGLTFGYNDTDPDPDRYPLVSAQGLEKLSQSGGSLTGGGMDGGKRVPSYFNPASWVEVIEIQGATESDRIARRNALKAVTAGDPGRMEEEPFVIHHGTDIVKTVFAWVVDRDIPTDEESLVRPAFVATIVFGAGDPITYGPTTTTAYAGAGAGHTITNAGWWPSERWSFTLNGPAVNPKIASSLDSTAAVRYVGTVDSGDKLYWEITPRSYRAEIWPGGVEADAIDIYGDCDGGVSTRPPQWFPLQVGAQTITYSRSSGSGAGSFVHRSAYP